jgi:hypothetical protein
MREQAPAGFRWLKPHEHRKAGDVYPDDSGAIHSVTIGWPINQDTILRPIKRAKRRWWYTARVENRTGIHGVFYSTTRPVIGATCAGIAAPNKIIGYRRELAPN